jgi:hypothetical protein
MHVHTFNIFLWILMSIFVCIYLCIYEYIYIHIYQDVCPQWCWVGGICIHMNLYTYIHVKDMHIYRTLIHVFICMSIFRCEFAHGDVELRGEAGEANEKQKVSIFIRIYKHIYVHLYNWEVMEGCIYSACIYEHAYFHMLRFKYVYVWAS